MINKEIIQSLGDKEMDRKDFLKYSGLVLLSLVGLKTIISAISQSDNKISISETNKDASRGFGSGKYGV